MVKKSLQVFVAFCLGASILCLLSAFQKIVAGYPLVLKGFYVPFFYGGVVGSLLGLFIFKIQYEKEKLQLISDFANDWEYWQSADGDFLYTSPSCESITGYTPEEFKSNPSLLEEIILTENLDTWQEHRHAKLSNGEVEPIEFCIRTKDGQTKWIHHVCRDVYGQGGQIYGVRGSNRDVTELKKLRDEVRVLKGYLPICASCKKIRDDKGYWQQLEGYIRDHSQAEFSHSICPDCARKNYPEYTTSKNGNGKKG